MVQVPMHDSAQRIVKKDPWLARLRGIYALLLLYIPLITLIYLITFLRQPTGFGLGLLIFLSVDLVFMIGLVAIQAKYWRKRRELRTRAVQGDPALLAGDQPEPDAQAVPLPMVIKVHTRMRAMVVLVAIMLGVMMVAIIAGFFIGFSQVRAAHPQENLLSGLPIVLIVMGIVVVFIMVVLLLAFALAAWLNKQKIEVTEEGITSMLWRKKQHMRWNEARFFSMGGSANEKRPTYYELSNERTNVVWMELRSRKFFLSGFLEPEGISLQEYEDEMKKLREIIAGKTGLKLYDLRNKTKGWLASI